MKVKEIMTKQGVQYCTPETRLHNAARMMKSANCGALPVLDDNKQVVGIVTDRDICLSLAQKSTKAPGQLTVADIMTKKVATVSPDADLDIALREMRTKKIGRLPVVDDEGKLKGIISLHNLLSKSTNGKTGLRGSAGDGESILKTVQALSDRYAGPLRGRKKALNVRRARNA